MATVILGATGATGGHLVTVALAHGDEVRALVRNPDSAHLPEHPRLRVVRADVHDAASIAAAITPEDLVLSGLGVPAKDGAGTLTAGARAVTAAHPRWIVWLGATGTGTSAKTINSAVAGLLRKGFGTEYGDKVTADTTILDAGGAVVHSGLITDKPDNPVLTLTPLGATQHRFFPVGSPRASAARLMLELAHNSAARPGLYLVHKR